MIVACDNLLSFFEKDFADGCEMHIVGITNEKLSSQCLFQIMNMTAESGLCQIKLVGGFAVVQQRGQCDEFVKSINKSISINADIIKQTSEC